MSSGASSSGATERPPRTLIIIGGPTASGKTRVAASLAKHFHTEVISADSRQFYKAMRIGTARPVDEELLGVPHHFLGHLDTQETWSAGTFARAAEPVLQDILQRTGLAVIVGGSGLYIDAVRCGLDPMPPGDPALRERLRERLENDGIDALAEDLRRMDPQAAERTDLRNPHRVIRAIEIRSSAGRSGVDLRTAPRLREDLRIAHIALDVPREQLYGCINDRVDRMITDGLVDEARELLPLRALNALNTVGYKELFDHFDGRTDPATAIALIKQHTRNYAKRQMTWLRRDPLWRWFAPDDLVGMRDLIAQVQRDGQT